MRRSAYLPFRRAVAIVYFGEMSEKRGKKTYADAARQRVLNLNFEIILIPFRKEKKNTILMGESSHDVFVRVSRSHTHASVTKKRMG